MAWKLIEEHVDMAEGLHRMIFEDASVTDRNGKPVRHEAAIYLKIEACPSCGAIQRTAATGEGAKIDAKEFRQQILVALEAHHAHLRAHAKKQGVRTLGTLQ